MFDAARFSIAYHISNPPQYYNLDVIISVGYRVKSKRGVAFRKWSNVKKGVEDIMGGEILELEADKILNRGIDIGMSEGLSIGRTEGLMDCVVSLVRDGLLDLAEGARRANMTQEEFARKVKDA